MSRKPIILIATDLGDASSRAVVVGTELARSSGADAVLLHVYDRPVFTHPELPRDLAEASAELERERRGRLEAAAAAAGGLRPMFRRGVAVDEILETIRELSPSMVVVGTHGHRGVKRVLLGSVAAQLVRLSTVPVLTVHPLGPGGSNGASASNRAPPADDTVT